MTEPKQPAAKTAVRENTRDSFRGSDAPDANAANVVYVLNNRKTPWVVALGKTLTPRRITTVDAKAWAAFKDSEFGKSLIEDGAIEETTAEALAEQPKNPQDLAAEQDEDTRAARQTPTKRSKK
jgi:hypothetical protein